MPGCVLRVSFPAESQLDAVLSWFPLETLAVFRKGQLPRPTAKRASSSTGFNVLVSDHDDDGGIEGQVKDAETFLATHHAILQRLLRETDACMCLDFGRHFQEDRYSCSNELPVSLLRACADLKVSIMVTVYPPSAPDE